MRSNISSRNLRALEELTPQTVQELWQAPPENEARLLTFPYMLSVFNVFEQVETAQCNALKRYNIALDSLSEKKIKCLQNLGIRSSSDMDALRSMIIRITVVTMVAKVEDLSRKRGNENSLMFVVEFLKTYGEHLHTCQKNDVAAPLVQRDYDEKVSLVARLIKELGENHHERDLEKKVSAISKKIIGPVIYEKVYDISLEVFKVFFE